jgi:hypothetical protein
MNLAQNKREVKRRTRFQLSNVMICEEDLERGKGRGRLQRKTFLLLRFLFLASICTASPQKQPFLYICDFTLARIRAVVCLVVTAWSGKWVPTCRRNMTIFTVEAYSERGGSMVSFLLMWVRDGTNFSQYFLFFCLKIFLSSIVYGCLALVLPNANCNSSVSESLVTHLLPFPRFSVRHKFQYLP